MEGRKIGIGDLRVYVPRRRLELRDLVARRLAENPDLARHLDRALATTGQRAIRFPAPHEDSATMGAEAAFELLEANRGALKGLRYLVAGTETGVDHSKPLSAYIQGMLGRTGLAIPSSLASFQVQHACAGGTLGLLSVAGLLAAAGRRGETGLVVAADVARYKTRSTAEITQGAGAAAMLIEEEPRLVELDLGTVGYSSADVDDFFRPLGSAIAMVKGTYSMECYQRSLEEAFEDHAARGGLSPEATLEAADLVLLHTPFRNMPEIAIRKLLARRLGLGEAAATAWLGRRGFHEGLDLIADIGNSYSASLWILLAGTLDAARRRLGEAIVGKRVLFASYGSGNVMAVFSGRVAPGAGAVIDSWRLGGVMDAAAAASMQDYDSWTAGYDIAASGGCVGSAPDSSFRLDAIREDGYREYGYGRCPEGDERP